jgi:zinc protease
MASLVRIKLREAMREDKGGVYGVTVRANYSQFPTPDYSITISFNAEPEEVEDLIATAKEEIRKIMENGASETDIKKVTETQLQGKIKNLKENGYWLGQLNARYQNDIPLEGLKVEALEKLIATLDSEVLQQAARRYFGTENFMQFVLLPEEGGE